jgi:NADP-dependent 3-hydroxy acid dehydrogenase YdfG
MGRREEILKKACEEIKKEFKDIKIIYIKGDVRDHESCKMVIQKTNEELGGIDILVNVNALYFNNEKGSSRKLFKFS